MSEDTLQKWCLEKGQSEYRGKQLFEWMYRHGKLSFNEMSNINLSFREYLDNHCIIKTIEMVKKIPSRIDNSIKILFKTLDGNFIETVSMIEMSRHTVCISSQIGCALDCSFCETGKMGLKRNLTVGEIVDQLVFVRELIKNDKKISITNVVFMGMGEPFQNYDNVMGAADIFHSSKGFNLAATKITISTVGILPKIKQFINEKRKYKLAISLNSAFDKSRTQIMPINKKWSIEKLISAGKEYSNLKKRQVMFEYVIIKGINDSTDDAIQLSNLLQGIPCKINIIPYNDTNGDYKRPDKKTISIFSKILHNNRDAYRVLTRWSKGQDINAGCGQLAVQQL